jgi:hypothetical protein
MRSNLPPRDGYTSAMMAIGNLLESDFSELEEISWTEALVAHSEIELLHLRQKTAAFYRHYLPLRQRMSGLLAESYRRLFRLALANPGQTGANPDAWAWAHIQPAVGAAVVWMREWFILACDGENQSVRHIGSLDFVPNETVSLQIPTAQPLLPPSASWRAPAWLFTISAVLVGIGLVKDKHIPNMDSDEKLGASHTRLLLKGARRVFLRELATAIQTVWNEETAAAGAIRVQTNPAPRREPNKRKGWKQKLKLYSAIQKILDGNPDLQGIAFCAELDKRHAPPLLDWIEKGEWAEGLTWKEAWNVPVLKPRIRRVRQEAQRAK